MALEWTRDLAVGNPHIDDQHRQLIQHFNEFLEACRLGRGKDRVTQLFAFLDQYVLSHFRDEESLMLRHGYPEREEHLAQHRYFKEKLKALEEALHREGPNAPLVIAANKTLLDWILRHIKQVDVRLGAYLRAAI